MRNLYCFIDVDGPLIPTPLFYVNREVSLKRTHISNVALGCIDYLIRQSGAKIVMNSTHNTHNVGVRTLKDDLLIHGFKDKWFHENWKTIYPNNVTYSQKYEDCFGRRLQAINKWIEENGECDWIAFDDDIDGFRQEDGSTHPNLIPIDFDKGIDMDSINQAFKIWNIKPRRILI